MVRTLVGTAEPPYGEIIRPPKGNYANSARYLLALLKVNGFDDTLPEFLDSLDPNDLSALPARSVADAQEPQIIERLTGITQRRRVVRVVHSVAASRYQADRDEPAQLFIGEVFRVDAVRHDTPVDEAGKDMLFQAEVTSALTGPWLSEDDSRLNEFLQRMQQKTHPIEATFRPFTEQLEDYRGRSVEDHLGLEFAGTGITSEAALTEIFGS